MPPDKPNKQAGAPLDQRAIQDQVDFAVSAFPAQLREFRNSLKLSQWSFGLLIGVSETTVYHLEQGRLPSFRTYTAILLLGFSPPKDTSRQPSVFEVKLSSSGAESGLWSKLK